MITLSVSQLEQKLRAVRGATFVSLRTSTAPDMRKTDNPYHGRVTKVSTVNAMIGFRYENSVNNQREREGLDRDFLAQPRAWGQRIDGTPLVAHKGKFYLECKVEHAETAFELEGSPIDRATLAPFLRQSHAPETQGTDKAVILRDYSLESITEIAFGGQRYHVRH